LSEGEFTDFLSSLTGAFLGTPTTSAGVIRNTTEIEDFIQEIRLVSTDDGPLEWIAGFFYAEEDKFFRQDAPVPGLGAESLALYGDADALCTAFGCPPSSPDNIFESVTTFDEKQMALFAEVGYEINDWAKLIVGARWYDYEQDFSFGENVGALAAGQEGENSISESGINPKVGMEFRPNDETMIYTTVSQGFRLGGNNDPLPSFCPGLGGQDSFDSDSLWNYEVGVKGDLGDWLTYSGAAYFIDWEDVPIANPLSCGFSNTINAGEVQVFGTEWELNSRITEQLIVGLSFGYINSEYGSDNLALGISKGQETPMVPEWTSSLDATYYFSVSDSLEGFVTADWSYRGSQYNTSDVATRVRMDSYNTVNARVAISSENWQLSLFANNLTDEHAVLFKDTVFLPHNRDFVNRPRTLGVTLHWNF